MIGPRTGQRGGGALIEEVTGVAMLAKPDALDYVHDFGAREMC